MRRALALVVLAAASVAGCKGSEGPVAGELSVRLTTPRNTDRAVMFVVVGKQSGVTAPSGSGYHIFSATSAAGDTTHVIVVAPLGQGVAAGEIARIAVNDTRQAASYAATLSDVASATLAVGALTGVSLAVVKP
jgi:hypothetical protein